MVIEMVTEKAKVKEISKMAKVNDLECMMDHLQRALVLDGSSDSYGLLQGEMAQF